MAAAGHTTKNVLLGTNDSGSSGAAIDVLASQTNQVISDVFRLSHEDSLYLRIHIVTSSTTVTNAITAKLQISMQGGANASWIDSKTASITGDGTTVLKLLANDAGDKDYLPLPPLARVVITTGVSDVTTIDAIYRTFRG